MADSLARRIGPFAAAEPVSMGLAPPATRFIFRGPPEAARLCGEAFGCGLPVEACRAMHVDEHAALWLGPDEWLLLAPQNMAADDVAARIERTVADVPHSLVDVSHRQVGIDLSGAGAARVINTGCPLDLDPHAFPVDMSTRTVLAKADIALWRRGENEFRIEVARSFAPYAMGVLRTASVM